MNVYIVVSTKGSYDDYVETILSVHTSKDSADEFVSLYEQNIKDIVDNCPEYPSDIILEEDDELYDIMIDKYYDYKHSSQEYSDALDYNECKILEFELKND